MTDTSNDGDTMASPITVVNDEEVSGREFAAHAATNQHRLKECLKAHYDFIVCGSGSSGSVVARRLAECASVSVLLLEAGGTDDVPDVLDAEKWPSNLGSERDWGFVVEPSLHVNNRAVPLSMGKVLGGGSSINVMIWARGHMNDWNFFAKESGDSRWNYDAVLQIYRRIEDWGGHPDPHYRGKGGPVYVEPAPNPNPIAPAMLQGASASGMLIFGNQNGEMMEGNGGASIIDVRARDGKRQSVFRSYVYPFMVKQNLTVLTHALVTRVLFEGKRAIGVEFQHAGRSRRVEAAHEVVLSLGAVHTPKVLMQSGIGDSRELARFEIPVVEHLPGVGQNFQDHVGIACVWEYATALAPRNTMVEATFFTKSRPELRTPDIQTCQGEFTLASPENAALFEMPANGWTLYGGIVRPDSRGRVTLSGARPEDPVRIHANYLSEPADVNAAKACVNICREIGNSSALRPFTKREVMPGNLKGPALEKFIRNAASTYWHPTSTAKMGRDSMAVVDSSLKVYGVDSLRVADASVMPRVTTGNTQAPCVIIGELAAEMLRSAHGLLPH